MRDAGARQAPAVNRLVLQKYPVPFVAHFGEDMAAADASHREGNALEQNREAPLGDSATKVARKICRIGRIVGSRAEMHDLAGWSPSKVYGCVGIIGPWPQEGYIINYGLFGQVQVHTFPVDGDCTVRHVHDPEQT